MAKKKAEPEPTKDRHLRAIMSFRPGEELRSVVESLSASERRTVSSMLMILVEEALAGRNLWPKEGRKPK